MIYNSGTKIIRVGNINKISDQNQTVFQYIKADSPTPPHDYSQDYLTFEALESGTFRFSGNSVNYSLDDGVTWTSLASNTESPTVNAGDKIMFKATLVPSYGIGRFSSTGTFNAMGNPYSLLYGDNFGTVTDLTGKAYAFNYIFNVCTGLTSAENVSLPATTLADYCYCGMFYNCSSLTKAPELPATALTDSCYYSMFLGTALTTAPELPAPTLTHQCYFGMFNSCSNMNYIKMLATDISATDCLHYWVNGVSGTGTFVKDASMSTLPTGNSGIPTGWTVQDNV